MKWLWLPVFLRMAAGIAAGSACLTPALAHPHVFIETSARLVFDTAGRLVAVENAWVFDEFYSSFVTLGLGEPGKPATEAQLRAIAENNIGQMQPYGWYNVLKIDGVAAIFDPPTDYRLTQTDQLRLLFSFTLPVNPAVAIGKNVELQILDPTYFVAFEAAKSAPLALFNPPARCLPDVARPAPLTPDDATKLLSAKKLDTRLAPEFSARLTSTIVLRCGDGEADK